jgi:hypothetical protein
MEELKAMLQEELLDTATDAGVAGRLREPEDLERVAARLASLAVRCRHDAYRLRHEPGLEDRGRA